MAKRSDIDIEPSKIQEAIRMLEDKKTKKSVCEFLGIAYNTSRLQTIIDEYIDGVKVDKEQRRKRRGKPITKDEIANFCEAYLVDDESIQDIGNRFFRSQALVRMTLDESGAMLKDPQATPLNPSILPERAVSLEFVEGQKVWSAEYNCLAEIRKVMPKDIYRLYLLDPSQHRFTHAHASNIGSLAHIAELGVDINRLGNVMASDEINHLIRTGLQNAKRQAKARD